MHFFYIFMMTLFVQSIYIDNNLQFRDFYNTCLLLGMAYPFFYDNMQLIREGPFEYFSSFWNYTDFLYNVLGVTNYILQFTQESPHEFKCKLIMILVIFLAIIKTFFFLRIFSSLSFLVTMLT